MKNPKRIIQLLVVAVLLAVLLSGCSLIGSGSGNGDKDTTYCKLIFMEVSGIHSIELDGTPITLPVPVKKGYTFDGWYTSKDYSVKFDQEYIENYQITSDLKLYPKWIKIEKVTLTLDVNGGDDLDVSTIEIEKDSSAPQELGIPMGIGMTFDGWFTKKTGGERITDSDGIIRNYEGDDATLYAHWTVAKYTITLSVEGCASATVSGGSDDSKLGDVITVSTSSKDTEHYIFDGWYNGSIKVGNFESYEHTVTGSVELTAKWIGKDVNVAFFQNKTPEDATLVNKNVPYGGSITYQPEERVDYAFTGWYLDRKCTGDPVSEADGKILSVMPTTGMTQIYYAGWEHLPEGNLSLEYNEASETYSVLGLNNKSLSVVYIPNEHNGIRVTEIKENAFSDIDGKSFVIPSTITEIENGAFADSATIYLDNGGDASLIKAPTFTESMTIYFHVLVSDGENALCDGKYAEADGKLITTEITSMDDAVSLFKYAYLYAVPSIEMHFTESAYSGDNAGFEAHVKSYLTGELSASLSLKANTASSYSYQLSATERTLRYEFTAENRVATKKTEGKDRQVQSYSANASFDGEEHDFLIDKKPEFYVETSEQMIYAVERGYRPYFASSDSEPALIYKKAREVLNAIVKDEMNDYDKLLAIHDWIALNVIYDSELYEMVDMKDDQIQQYRGFCLEGVFVDGRAVCDGITKAFTLMARIEGIECIRVSGQMGGTGHAWNKVKIDGIWYAVDVTGDDAILSLSGTETKYEELRHDYFLISDAKISATHRENDTSTAPTATGEYNYFVNNEFSANTQTKLETYFKKVVEIAKTAPSGSAIVLEVNTKGITDININYLYYNISGCTVYGGTPSSDGVCVFVVITK